jgi:hypothetical protein
MARGQGEMKVSCGKSSCKGILDNCSEPQNLRSTRIERARDSLEAAKLFENLVRELDESATCEEYLQVQLNWPLNNMKSFISTGWQSKPGRNRLLTMPS